MKKVQTLIAMTVITSAMLSAGTAWASPAVAYYHFSDPWGAAGYTNTIDSPTFTVTNSSNVVTINGWQSTPSAGTPSVDYELRKTAFIGSSSIATIPIAGSYPQNGTWYSRTFTSVSIGSGYFIRMTPKTSAGMDGAGNAYDGY